MKKKLKLHRETIQVLSDKNLSEVHGGFTVCCHTDFTCGCTGTGGTNEECANTL